ncbi:hypothetical protein PCC8801_0821 [Rippkaea orientalis PCC 8801]|uniref:Uncharacterized protein n=1 Tax=Rippkaea orientalis (strain PCC 8801 / RF-1) TaxID=41431 RepID=B7JYN3_RIPO1|nr:hypothetical protein PCC8801_0821 [Rippkaea orientalis PCC 8801]
MLQYQCVGSSTRERTPLESRGEASSSLALNSLSQHLARKGRRFEGYRSQEVRHWTNI